MILVDTNVWSEPLRPVPDQRVLQWMLAHEAELAISAISAGELWAGLALMPAGRRRDQLSTEIERLLAGLEARTLLFDLRAARAYGGVRASLRRGGREPFRAEDAMIAAIALARGMPVATLNTGDFVHTGVEVIDPRSAVS